MSAGQPRRRAGAPGRATPVALLSLVVMLALANLAVYAGGAGWLDALLGTTAPVGGRDAARLSQQVRPDAVRVLVPDQAAPVLPAASSAAAPDAPPS